MSTVLDFGHLPNLPRPAKQHRPLHFRRSGLTTASGSCPRQNLLESAFSIACFFTHDDTARESEPTSRGLHNEDGTDNRRDSEKRTLLPGQVTSARQSFMPLG